VIADGARPIAVKWTDASGHPTVLFSHVLSSLALCAAALHLGVRRRGVYGALYLRPNALSHACPRHGAENEGGTAQTRSPAPVGSAGCPPPLTRARWRAVGSALPPAARW